MNKVLNIRTLLLLSILCFFNSGLVHAFRPTYSHGAKVTAVVTTGSGYVYVSMEESSPRAIADSEWQAVRSEGGNSSETRGASMPVFLYAKPVAGYDFTGWFQQSTGGSAVDTRLVYPAQYTVHNASGNGTVEYQIYARFAPVPCTITYDPDGGTVAGGNSQAYNIESTSTLRTATKVGSDFTGWKVTAADGNWTLNTLHPEGESLTGMHGNVTLTAQWDVLACDIVISVTGLLPGESAIFNVSRGGSVLYTVAVPSGSSVTIKDQEAGQYTVEPTSWTWAYNMTPSSLTRTLTYPDTLFEFAATASGTTKKHDEQSNVNWGL